MQPDERPGLPHAGRRLPAATARNVLFVLLGVGGLVLKGRYSGPGQDLVHSYGGNVAASLAVYFWARLATGPFAARFLADLARREQRLNLKASLPRMLAAGLALVIVQLFEVFDGFGVMTNVYDRVDFAANAAGIAIALALDAARAPGRQEAGQDRNQAIVTERSKPKR